MAVILGSATVFATGLLSSAQRLNDSLSHIEAVQVQVVSPPPGVLAGGPAEEPGVRQQKSGTRMSDAEVEAFLRTLPGAKYVTSQREADTAVGGLTETAALYAYTGDSAHLGYELLSGRWFSGAGEAVVSPEMLRLTGKSVGDTLTLTLDGHAVAVRIVGEAFTPRAEVHLDRDSVSFLDSQEPAGDRPSPVSFLVGLAPGTSAAQFLDSVAGGADAGLIASYTETDQIGMAELRIVVGTLTIALVVVAGLGIAHTVVLNTRERRRDLAIVKAVGMTPGQVVIMAVTSMAILGFIGGVLGLPGGVAAQRAVMGLIAEADKTRYPQSILDVYAPAAMVGLLLCGVLIAVFAALIPARKAARISTASALHSE